LWVILGNHFFCLNIDGNGWDQTWDFFNTGREHQRTAERKWRNLTSIQAWTEFLEKRIPPAESKFYD
jgi:hypothetical protein